jgi:hypothetical protein
MKRSILLFLTVVSNSASAQVLDQITLRAHSTDKNLTAKPALVQYTDADGKDSSYLLDAALKYTSRDFAPGFDLAMALEAHKNTLVTRKQDTRSVKLIGSYQWRTDCGVRCVDSVDLDGTMEYQDDSAKDNESSLVYFELAGVNEDLRLNAIGTEALPWYWAPTVGVEYEDFNKSAAGNTGDLIRLYSDLEIGFYPFFETLEGRLSLSGNYSHWRDSGKDSSLQISDDSHELTQISLRYSLTPADSKIGVALSLDWLDGENPRTKKEDQQYFQIGLGIKI